MCYSSLRPYQNEDALFYYLHFSVTNKQLHFMKTGKRFTLVLFTCSLWLTNLCAYGQLTPLPYYENFDTSANVRWTAYQLGTTNPDDFPWNITVHNPYSPAFSMMHTCNTGTTQANDWAVCRKAFSFATGGKIDSIRSWITATAPPATGDTIGIYLLTGSEDPGTTSAKTLLYDFRGANFQTDSWIKTTNITIPPTPGMSFIAFRYKTANNCINIFLDNMHVSGNTGTGIIPKFKAGEDFNITPNPVVNNLTIQSKEQVEVINIYDLAGRKMHNQPFQPTIDVAFLAQGTYVLELIGQDGKRGMQKIVKQ